QEKPRLEEAYSNLINAGCYIVERSVIQDLSTEYHSMERDVFPGVAESGRMGGYRYSGRFIDAGTPTSYLEAMVAAIKDNSFNTGGIVGTSWYADPKMSKKGIENSAVGMGCKLSDGIRVNRSAILEGAQIGENAHLDNCLIGRGSTVPANSHLVDTVIGFNQQYQ
ncbi:MAG: NDP-sugar synthase, partial [Candidatus Thermoplasmatota archaeon]|nr:NDP-sugar synthase [Candidatus Thermoplasmatota archaeon]